MGVNVLHSLGTTGPVAVVEVQLLTLQNKCAEAILEAVSDQVSGGSAIDWKLTWPFATCRSALIVIFVRPCQSLSS